MAKKKREATAKVKEAAPTYTARSRPSRARKAKKAAPSYETRSRKTTASQGEALWDFFLTLSDDEQGAFIERMLGTAAWREEIGDSIIVIESRGQPTRPIEEFFAELDQERGK